MGTLRLLPFARAHLPGDLPSVTQRDIDDVTLTYVDCLGRPIQHGAIVEYDGYSSGDDAEPFLDRLFHARDCVAFSALDRRSLFRRHNDYTNRDAFGLVVQRFSPGSATAFAITSRRRDGVGTGFWDSDSYCILRPLHVPDRMIRVDLKLLACLLSLPVGMEFVSDAIVEFNAANTDSPDVPEHSEAIMLKSAFERLLRINQNAEQFSEKLISIATEVNPAKEQGYCAASWKARWQAATTSHEAWAREFCAFRGSVAHGLARSSKSFTWGARGHLAFASTLFPWLVRWILDKHGHLPLDGLTRAKLCLIDRYLEADPFAFDFTAAERSRVKHPWEIADSDAMDLQLTWHREAGK